MSVTERLVTRLATLGRRPTSRRAFLASATLAGTALAIDPLGFITKPQSAYATVCGPDSACGDGYTVMCCTINNGHNTCPPNTYAGGWWKADRSSFCNDHARYYIDCNAKPGTSFHCRCNDSTCDRRRVACNIFRYGQCNTQIAGVTAVVCRQISCTPPWRLYPGACGTSSATDNNTLHHSAPCLNSANTFPVMITFPDAPHVLPAGHHLLSGHRLVSDDRHTQLTMQPNGDLVLRNESGIIWHTRTATVAAGGSALMHRSGRLLVLDKNKHVRFITQNATTGATPSLRVRNIGQLAIFRGDTQVVWHTPTHTP
jgi:hypothetical protein